MSVPYIQACPRLGLWADDASEEMPQTSSLNFEQIKAPVAHWYSGNLPGAKAARVILCLLAILKRKVA